METEQPTLTHDEKPKPLSYYFANPKELINMPKQQPQITQKKTATTAIKKVVNTAKKIMSNPCKSCKK